MKQPKYDWCEPAGVATCTLYYKDKEFLGQAYCHTDDTDMRSKLTGKIIAEFRATIKYLQFIRDYEVRPQLRALYQLYYSMKHSTNFNPKSYEAKALYRQIRNLEKDLTAVKEELADTRKCLKEYVNLKEKDYQKIREYRNKKQLVENNQ